MSIIGLIKNKREYDKNADRIGPDIPFTHWRLYFKPLMIKLCKKKFKEFSDSSEFRPGAYAIVCSKIRIGKRVVIRPGSMLFADPSDNGAGITIEDDVLIGSGVHFYVGNHKFTDPTVPIIDQGHSGSHQIILKKGCWIGANVIILQGVIIGGNSVIGAGSVVTSSIPDAVIAAGNPCKIIRIIDSKNT
jgi:acetyltransferase-like isoleucine patch superfamily enzyme